jgi:hypothetical protein
MTKNEETQGNEKQVCIGEMRGRESPQGLRPREKKARGEYRHSGELECLSDVCIAISREEVVVKVLPSIG